MKILCSVAMMLLLAFEATGQGVALKTIQATMNSGSAIDTTQKPNKYGWIMGANCSVSLTQVSNSNWIAAGGDKFSISSAASVNAYASKRWGKKSWDNLLDVNYGLLNTTSLGTRKINDRLDFTSKFGYQPTQWKNARLSIFAQLRSQLTSGYEYDYLGTTSKRRNSGFFAPAYITLAPGIDWTPTPWLTVFASPAATRWTIASNNAYSFASPSGIFNGKRETPLATLYGVDTLKKVRTEFGGTISVSVRKEIMKNITYNSKLDLYSNYLKNAANIDVFWTNQFKLKVNKYIQVSYALDLLYDDDVKNPLAPTRALGLQTLSTLGVGFALKM